MTDKEQIIIDGVDVSKCKYYALQKHYDIESDGLWKVCYSKDCKYSICANNYDCYYKQFKRKEQECKKLNNKIIDMNSIIEDAAINLGNKDFTLYDLPFEIKKLSSECENLKAEEKYLKQCCQKAGEELAKHSFEYDGKEKNLVVQAIELNEKYNKLQKALKEIEEYCEEQNLKYDTTACMILDIINKVKDGN